MSLKADRNKKKLANIVRKGFRGYPMATLAYYGPTDKKATKVTVGIILSERSEPDPLRCWLCETDVRHDPSSIEEILLFLEEQSVTSVVAVDRIIGCPHQEGIDYPDGEACPECTFWKGRDRWTGDHIH
ncbi:MAG: hypothetical protein PHH11_11425 [Methylomonas sp.]|nr:hypothetical protein [Methylomonas sp.]